MGEARYAEALSATDQKVARKRQTASAVLEVILKSLVLVVPVLYAAGREYTNQYWAEIGLPASMVDVPFELALYHGFFALALGLIELLTSRYVVFGVPIAAFVWLLASVAIAHATPAVRQWKRKPSKPRPGAKRLGRLRKYRFFRRLRFRAWWKHHERIFSSGYLFVWIPYTALVALYLLLVAAAVSLLGIGSLGKKEAEEHRSKYLVWERGQPDKKALSMVFSQNGVTKEALYLECHPVWCVGFEKDNFFAIKADAVVAIKRVELRSSTARAKAEEPPLGSDAARPASAPRPTTIKGTGECR